MIWRLLRWLADKSLWPTLMTRVRSWGLVVEEPNYLKLSSELHMCSETHTHTHTHRSKMKSLNNARDNDTSPKANFNNFLFVGGRFSGLVSTV